MEEIVLTPRKADPVEVFKAVRIIGHEPHRFVGHLRYLRVLHPGYDYKIGDALDKSILECLKSMYSDAYLSVNMLLLFEKQFEDCMRVTAGIESPVLAYFYQLPIFNGGTATTSSAYTLPMKFTLWVQPGDQSLSFMHKEIFVRVDGGQNLRNLMATIKAV